MGKKSRDKGASFEREVVGAFKAADIHAERRAPLQANSAIADGDVVADGIGMIECKRRKNGFSLIYDAMQGNDAVVIRSDRKPALIVFELSDFLAREGRQ
ncbi:MAG: hypothetical protein AAFQ29_10725 [Pseudomonadota bacterium]